MATEYSVHVTKFDDSVCLHTFLGSENVLANASHIVEGPTKLVVVDGHIDLPSTQGFLKYIDMLGKPVARVYVSHAHVDHFVTLSLGFEADKVYALRETIRVIAEKGEQMRVGLKAFFGDAIPASVVVPGNAAEPGEEIIDGIRFVFEHVENAEADHQLVIKLPKFKTVIAQDLVYSGTHLYFDTLELDNWFVFLESISDYDIVLPGHGKPTDKEEVRLNIDYLKAAMALAQKHYPDIDAFKSAILSAYPHRTVAALIDIYTPRLFAHMAEKAENRHS